MGFMLELLSLLFMISVFLSLCSSSSTALVDDVFLFCSFFFVFACFLCLCQVLVFGLSFSYLQFYFDSPLFSSTSLVSPSVISFSCPLTVLSSVKYSLMVVFSCSGRVLLFGLFSPVLLLVAFCERTHH